MLLAPGRFSTARTFSATQAVCLHCGIQCDLEAPYCQQWPRAPIFREPILDARREIESLHLNSKPSTLNSAVQPEGEVAVIADSYLRCRGSAKSAVSGITRELASLRETMA